MRQLVLQQQYVLPKPDALSARLVSMQGDEVSMQGDVIITHS